MRLKLNAIIIATIFTVVIGTTAYLLENAYENWTNEVISTNRVLCEVIVKQLNTSSQKFIDSLYNSNYFSEGYQNTHQLNNSDKLLSQISSRTLESAKGLEGGFYFSSFEQFQGYSYPTSPPPKPVYGPPPRSYNIIKEQINESIKKDSLIIQLHQFDPAVFPLASIPIKVNGIIVGAAWVRIHIERELPTLKLSDILNIAAVISLLGFIIAAAVTMRLRKRLETIRSELNNLESNTKHRLKPLPGVFGDISNYINKMVDSLQYEHDKRVSLERELHQQDKMASLGNLVAGVAHEVKTPLAIIKTRIQMWQQKLKKNETDQNEDELITKQSLQLVINEINRLSNLVNKLLIFSKPVDEKFQSMDINRLIEDLLALFTSKRYTEKAELIFNKWNSSIFIEMDPNKIEQVILNILTNSFESIKSKGKIVISTRHENDYGVIKISDNGVGIPKDLQNNIFDPFYTTKGGGTGLGLSIAYEIVNAHDGKIEFSSEENSGTTFEIYLPLTQKDN